MEYLAKFRDFSYYKWVYIAGIIITFLNCMFIHSVQLMKVCLVVLYCILFYKGIEILRRYKKVGKKAYQKIDKRIFDAKYRSFRIKVFLFLFAFIILCMIAKFVVKIDYNYFYSCTFFFLLLDRLFVNTGCLLRIFSDAKNVVSCCCGCPCRGWDLIMIHTPLMFALNCQCVLENVLIVASSVLAFISFVCWERNKYILVETRERCEKACNLSLCRENLN